MHSVASAPNKIILFGEHAVVYKKPAIAVAINKRAKVSIKNTKKDSTIIKCNDIGLHANINPKTYNIEFLEGKKGILNYILEVLKSHHDNSPIKIDISLEVPLGIGLGSSAAITVALIAALHNYHEKVIDKSSLSKKAHEIELKVQGAASPLDTAVSTYGGMIYLKDSNIEYIKPNIEGSFIVAYTPKPADTKKMVSLVKKKLEKYPNIVGNIIDTIGNVTKTAYELIKEGKFEKIGELMNINHGLLDSIGVSSSELSQMVYSARNAGALGSKITGAGGSGSIIAYCINNEDKVLNTLKSQWDAFKTKFSKDGVIIH